MILELTINPDELAKLFYAIASERTGAWRGVGVYQLIKSIFNCTYEEAEMLYSHGLRKAIGQDSELKVIIYTPINDIEKNKKKKKEQEVTND